VSSFKTRTYGRTGGGREVRRLKKVWKVGERKADGAWERVKEGREGWNREETDSSTVWKFKQLYLFSKRSVVHKSGYSDHSLIT